MNSDFQQKNESSQEVTQAFTYTDDTGRETSDDFEPGSLNADIPTSNYFAPDFSLGLTRQIPDFVKPSHASSSQSIGEFTDLKIEPKVLVDGVAKTASTITSVGHRAVRAKTIRRAKELSRMRTAKDFAAANAAMEKSAAEANGLPVQVKKPIKKRIRRQREELLYLRLKVQEMESSLKKMKSELSFKGDSMIVAVHGTPNLERSTPMTAVWKNLAIRQYKDRERAEKENRKLKSTLESQIKLTQSLEKVLADQLVEDMSVSWCSYFC